MIEKILERLEEARERFSEMAIVSNHVEDYEMQIDYNARLGMCEKAIEIVQEVAKESGKDTNVPSRCDTCTHYVDEKTVPPICYMCSKGIEDNYKQKGE